MNTSRSLTIWNQSVVKITREQVAMKLIAHPDAIGEVYNIGSTQEVTILQLAQRVIELTGSRSDIVFMPYDQAYEAGFEDMMRRVPDISKIKALIGYQPTFTLEQTLNSVIDSIRAKTPSG